MTSSSGASKDEEGGMKKPAIRVRVLSNGEPIGTLTPEEFRAGTDTPKSVGLFDAIIAWNGWKERKGEPERARMEIRGIDY